MLLTFDKIYEKLYISNTENRGVLPLDFLLSDIQASM